MFAIGAMHHGIGNAQDDAPPLEVPPEQAYVPIYQRSPYDEITLRNGSEQQTFKLRPVDIPNRLVPQNPERGHVIKIRLYDRPEDEYEIAWRNIVKLELFEYLILAEVNKLVAEKKFDEVYDHFVFLRNNYPQLPGLRDALGGYLYANAGQSYKAGNLLDAHSLLEEAYRIDAKRSGLSAVLGRVVAARIQEYVGKKDFASARVLLRNALKLQGEDTPPDVTKWRERLIDAAKNQLQQAEVLLKQEKPGLARAAVTNAIQIWPSVEGIDSILTRVSRAYPLVIVGVTQKAPSAPDARLWSGRRSQRLQIRSLAELTGFTSDGGQYHSPVGNFTRSVDHRTLSLQVNPGKLDAAALSGFDVARSLLAVANKQPQGGWSGLLESVDVPKVYRVDAKLSRVHVNPAAFLASVPCPTINTAEGQFDYRPYVMSHVDERTDRFILRKEYPLSNSIQPREVVERYFVRLDQAVNSLLQRRVDALDWIDPADRHLLEKDNRITVMPYATPSSHMLLVNRTNPFLAKQGFRRALVYGIQRQNILRNQLLGGSEVQGCKVITGPVPASISEDGNPYAYAYNSRLTPRGYGPGLALTLSSIARREIVAKAHKAGKQPPADRPLVLAYPTGDLYRLACEEIASDLTRVKIPVTLRALPMGVSTPADNQWDLLYTHLNINEPLTDLPAFLRSARLVDSDSPYLSLALRQAESATSLKEVRERFQELHHRLYDKVLVIPLWQMTDYFAYGNWLQGVGDSPVSLYQNIDDWQAGPLKISEGQR